MQYSSDKDINLLIKEMLRSGWHFERGRHGKLHHPTGFGFVTFAKTPSDHRCLLNIQRDIRRLEQKIASHGQGLISAARPASGPIQPKFSARPNIDCDFAGELRRENGNRTGKNLGPAPVHRAEKLKNEYLWCGTGIAERQGDSRTFHRGKNAKEIRRKNDVPILPY